MRGKIPWLFLLPPSSSAGNFHWLNLPQNQLTDRGAWEISFLEGRGVLGNMGVDLRANRQMTTMRCRNEDQEISEEDVAMVQVRVGSAWEHNGDETLNLDRLIIWMWGEWEREVSRKLLRRHYLEGEDSVEKVGVGAMSQGPIWGTSRCPVVSVRE